MDNLKFTAEMMPVEIEGTIEQKKQTCLVVQTYTRNSINYKMTIINPDLVQYPEVFITQKMAIESIIKHIHQEPQYIYDEKTDIIEIKYKMFDTHGICLHLKKDLTQMPTVEQRITKLELLLDALTLDELIESHTYPEWSTYEEFMKLPSYKYFDACYNAQRYFNREPMLHLGKFRGVYYSISRSQPILNVHGRDDLEKNKAMESLACYVKPINIHQNKEWELTTKDSGFYSTMYRQQNPGTSHITTSNHRDYFEQSLKTFLKFYSNNNRLCEILNEYFRIYIFGFYMINHAILIGRELRIEVHLVNDKLYLHIFRSKRITFSHADIKHTASLNIHYIDHIKHDGVYI